jgi:uncharacterized protein (UPF0179 family)
MPLVTLIGESLASPGLRFIYMGPINDCKNCKLKTVCFNLKAGRQYEITAVREKQHTCQVHDGNVVVVEVKELPIIISIDAEVDVGASIKIKKKKCRQRDCENYDICMNPAVSEDKPYTVATTPQNITCPLKYTLYKVEVTE